ncbi:hypothetical protein NUACC21_58040 [Scytonema sp. NUACC21]
MQPTIDQLKTLYRVCVMVSNLLKPINLTRLDETTKHIFILVGETIEIEIDVNGEMIYGELRF